MDYHSRGICIQYIVRISTEELMISPTANNSNRDAGLSFVFDFSALATFYRTV